MLKNLGGTGQAAKLSVLQFSEVRGAVLGPLDLLGVVSHILHQICQQGFSCVKIQHEQSIILGKVVSDSLWWSFLLVFVPFPPMTLGAPSPLYTLLIELAVNPAVLGTYKTTVTCFICSFQDLTLS